MSQLILNKLTHTYFENDLKVPGVSEVLQAGGFVDFSMVKEDVLEASQEFGNVAHDTFRLYDLDRLMSCDSLIEPYLDGWKKFVTDYKPHFYLIEEALFSKVWRFAGTPDRMGLISGDDSLIDIKTGAIMKHHELQFAGYEILGQEHLRIKKLKHKFTVKIEPGNYRIIPHTTPTAKAVFIGAVQGWHWKYRNGGVK